MVHPEKTTAAVAQSAPPREHNLLARVCLTTASGVLRRLVHRAGLATLFAVTLWRGVDLTLGCEVGCMGVGVSGVIAWNGIHMFCPDCVAEFVTMHHRLHLFRQRVTRFITLYCDAFAMFTGSSPKSRSVVIRTTLVVRRSCVQEESGSVSSAMIPNLMADGMTARAAPWLEEMAPRLQRSATPIRTNLYHSVHM